ncbi:formin-binding protein 1-like isoform X6 [Phlebotomus argentipes]|uniref:formin-binding protein 1-like isoform X6 n=1 Tax=Phlebotomus argentipes TaxID=94469 RepID=UPI002893391D|nr:formin-binding protein 1-like isoform X6 [Phlebotomus argentipes]
MSWGTELWDQYDNLALHTQKGIDFLDKYGNFVRDRCAIELEYASKLRRLVKNYQPKKKEEEDYEYTSWQAFRNVLKEIGDLAGQREIVAETLQAKVIHGISLLSKNLRDDRKKSLTEGAQLTHTLTNQIAALERAKRNYDKSYRDAEKSIENYQKADADLNLSRADVEKHKHNMTMKCQQSDDSKNEYANQLQKSNKLQQTHYETSLPEVFNRLQEIDEKRTKGLKEFIKSAADAESSVAPIIARCLEGIVKASESIDEKEDSLKVIERYKSGFTPPTDIPFEDLSKVDAESSNYSSQNNLGINNMTQKGTMGATKLKKRVGIFGIFGSNKLLEACITVKNTLSTDGMKEDFSDLPPNQRRKKLMAKIQEIQQKITQETAAYDGLVKMKGVYEANTMLGDPTTVDAQLNESGSRLEKLKSELKKFKMYLDAANNAQMMQHSPQQHRNMYNGQRSSRHSNGSGENEDGEDNPDDAGSLSSSSASPESGLGTSHTSLPGSGQGSANDNTHPEDMYYEAELLQPLGTCKALYPFDATSEGSIPMAEGEELQVIELDQGDGWTRVRRMCGASGWEEGFVPTSYIESTLYA